jgi:hypothetical protein
VAKRTIDILNAFKKKLVALESTRIKLEILFSKDKLAKRDIEEVYSSLFISTTALFESAIENLFLGLLTKQIKHSHKSFKAKIVVKNIDHARAVVCPERKYIDWLPYERTVHLANIFFKDGLPFNAINNDDVKTINDCLIIRNALAHQSNHSLDKFKKNILSSRTINSRDRKPKKFLRIQFSSSPPTNYYQYYTSELLRLLKAIC